MTFKPVFDGYMKIYLHDETFEKASDRSEFSGQWIASRRKRIVNRDRKYQVTLHIFDTDGNKRGLQTMVFSDKGCHGALSTVIFDFGNDFVNELRANDDTLRVDLTNSYAVVRA